MKISADLGGCYRPGPSASVDNTLLDPQNSSYPTQPHLIIAKSISGGNIENKTYYVHYYSVEWKLDCKTEVNSFTMALFRGHKLMLHTVRQSWIRCFRSSSVVLSSGTQSEFTGLENCFIWDDKHGFGFNKDGEVVIVRPNTSTGTSPTATQSPVFSSEDLNIPSPDLMEQDPKTGDEQMNTA